MTTSIDCVIFTINQGNSGLLLRQFQLDQDNEPAYINPNIPAQIIIFLTQLLNYIPHAAANHILIPALRRFLRNSFAVFQNGTNPVNHVKLAVMVIDDALNFNIDPLMMSNEFNRYGIHLVVVAHVTAPYEIWNFYNELAYNTDGVYMLFANVESIFKSVVLPVLVGEETLRQAFLHINTNEVGENSFIVNSINDMNQNNQITDGVGDLPFDHGLSQ